MVVEGTMHLDETDKTIDDLLGETNSDEYLIDVIVEEYKELLEKLKDA